MSTCFQKGHPHNARCRYTHGFLCEDCGVFFPEGSEGYARYELPSSLCMVLQNIRAAAIIDGSMERDGQEAREIGKLQCLLDTVPAEEDEKRREEILNAALLFIASHGKTPESATFTI